jgi:hypothetical protein
MHWQLTMPRPENLPPYPADIPLELLPGAIPAALVFYGLKRRGPGGVAGTLFLLNPAILFPGMWLRLPVSLQASSADTFTAL